mgnify:CR=1 FL=1
MLKLLAQHAPEVSETDARLLVQLGEGSIGTALDYA